jgi:hypothetical protein
MLSTTAKGLVLQMRRRAVFDWLFERPEASVESWH